MLEQGMSPVERLLGRRLAAPSKLQSHCYHINKPRVCGSGHDACGSNWSILLLYPVGLDFITRSLSVSSTIIKTNTYTSAQTEIVHKFNVKLLVT